MSTVDTMANPTAQYEACQKDVAASKGSADFDPADFLHVAKVARLAHVKAELTKPMHRTPPPPLLLPIKPPPIIPVH